MFGQPRDPYSTPFLPEDDGLGGPLAAAVATPAAPLAAAVRPHRGLGTRDIVGILADAILAGTGRPAVYGPAVQHRSLLREQQQTEESEYQRHRRDTNADWMARQEYERAHPAPAQPTTLQREAEYYRSIGRSDLADTLLTNRAAPLVAVDRYDAASGNMVRDYVRPAQPQTAPAPRLRQLPPGSVPVQGGPTPSASGNFR